MDFPEFFERIESHYDQSLPLVVYRKPNTDAVLAMLQDNNQRYTTTNYTETGFIFAPFDSKEEVVLIPLEHSETLSVVTLEPSIQINKAKLSSIENDSAKTFHINLVEKGIETIKQGNLRKVVLSRKEVIPVSEVNPFEIFERMLSHYPSAFVYCFYHPKVGTWLGATPETLLKIEGHKIFTTALAGTQKYEGSMEVHWGSKEMEEQQLVTNFIVDNLKPLVNHMNLDAVQTIKAGGVLHLRTNISGTLSSNTVDFQQILNTLHPTPAVCGVPKAEAKAFILQHENYHREFYTGFLGELNLKEKRSRQTMRHNAENDAFTTVITVSNLYVNLRCMQLKNAQTMIYVGGGITKDSIPEAEWEETVNKAQTIKSVI